MLAMIDHDWQNAIAALIASTKPNTKPLAMWLRSEKPIPPGIRDSIAELLDPGKPPLYNVRLTPKFIKTQNKHVAFFMKWTATRVYDELRAKGVSEKDALMEVARALSTVTESGDIPKRALS
jgi:hypothetical protein